MNERQALEAAEKSLQKKFLIISDADCDPVPLFNPANDARDMAKGLD
jgi:hypothetical protein